MNMAALSISIEQYEEAISYSDSMYVVSTDMKQLGGGGLSFI
jgi:hypothetical protein